MLMSLSYCLNWLWLFSVRSPGTCFMVILIWISNFHSIKCIWNCYLQNGSHFVCVSMHWMMILSDSDSSCLSIAIQSQCIMLLTDIAIANSGIGKVFSLTRHSVITLVRNKCLQVILFQQFMRLKSESCKNTCCCQDPIRLQLCTCHGSSCSCHRAVVACKELWPRNPFTGMDWLELICPWTKWPPFCRR